MKKYVFGPVSSRRLGRSLGVDLVPFKTCSYDCIYCQLGRTTCKTIERKAWVPVDDLLSELEDGLASQPDYITFSGSGEPTLNAQMGELIDRIKRLTNVPLAVLTNGSLLWMEEVRRQLAHADLVLPSLDAGDENAFRRVNRPHHEVSFEKLLDGLVALGSQFRGEYWLEVFLLANLTANDADVSRLATCVDRIRPGRVQLTTVSRPPVESFAVAVPDRRLRELAGRFRPPAQVVSELRPARPSAETATSRDHILELLRRRPCTIGDIAEGLGMHFAEVVKWVEQMTSEKLLVQSRSGSRSYYQVL